MLSKEGHVGLGPQARPVLRRVGPQRGSATKRKMLDSHDFSLKEGPRQVFGFPHLCRCILCCACSEQIVGISRMCTVLHGPLEQACLMV